MKAYWGLEAWLDVVSTSALDESGFTVLRSRSFPARRGTYRIGDGDSRDTMGASEKRKHVFLPGNPTSPVFSWWLCWQLCGIPHLCVKLALGYTARYHIFRTAYLDEIFSDRKESETDVCIHPVHYIKTAKNWKLWLFIITHFSFNYAIICGHQFFVF